MSEVFKTIGINFNVGDEVATVECTPKWGNLRIVGTGANNSMEFHFPTLNSGSDRLKKEDLDNFIAALQELRKELFESEDVSALGKAKTQLKCIERDMVLEALNRNQGDIEKCGRDLGISAKRFSDKMDDYCIGWYAGGAVSYAPAKDVNV